MVGYLDGGRNDEETLFPKTKQKKEEQDRRIYCVRARGEGTWSVLFFFSFFFTSSLLTGNGSSRNKTKAVWGIVL